MNKLTVAILALALTGSVAFAQGQGNGGGRGNRGNRGGQGGQVQPGGAGGAGMQGGFGGGAGMRGGGSAPCRFVQDVIVSSSCRLRV